jgi:hypothetical protein
MLAEARKAGPPRKAANLGCPIGAWLAGLSDADREDAVAILAGDSGWMHKDVTALLEQMGVPALFGSSVAHHRRGDCACDKSA